MNHTPHRERRPLGSIHSFYTLCSLALSFFLGQVLPSTAHAEQQRLADLSYKAHRVEANAVVIDTSGKAKIRIAFVTPAMARVEIARTGTFTTNASPAVEKQLPPLREIQVVDRSGMLVIKSAGLSLHIDKAHLRIDAYDKDDVKPLSLESPEDGTSWDTESGALRHSRILTENERIYGLGQDNANKGMLDRRGTNREMWTGQQINSGNVTANYPVPFYLSTGPDGRAYGCLVDNVWHMNFDLGKSQKDRLTWTSPGGPLDYYLINGPAFKTIINQYTQLTGRPTMLPLYAFGYWQSRCFYNSFPDIEKTVKRLKAGGLPLDVMVIDSDWNRVDVDFVWKDKFLDNKPAEEWLKELHEGGAKVMLSTKGPMIREDAENYPEAFKKGLFATDGKGKTLKTGYYGGQLMDFTHPDMEAWLTTQLKPLSKQGIDDWWLDLIEPEGEPPQAVYKMGKSADIHNTFPLLNYRTYFNYERTLKPQGRPVILGRAASAGTQRYSGIVWSGDINSDWPTFQAHIPEAQNTGLSGLPYWANDSGGFISGFVKNDRYGAHAELYQRWFQFTCFAPITRAHKAGPSEPYEYGPEVEANAKKYLELRYRLLPYVYNIAHEAATTGVPMLRPLILEYQNDPASATAKTQYLFGPDLLVAPVIWANTTSRQVYFPPGRWISYDEGFETPGGVKIGVSAPRDRIPLFVRAGTILPTAPDMMYSSEKPWDPITLDIWPAGQSTGSLYQDDTFTTAYTKGESTTTSFQCIEEPGKKIAFNIVPSNKKYGPKRWIAKFHLTSVPTAVAMNGTTLVASNSEAATAGWNFDATTGTLTVRLPGDRMTRNLAITLDGSSHPRPAAPKIDAPENGAPEAIEIKQIAQFLPPPKLPFRVEAANYDKGGEGLAFHITSPVTDSAYRQDGVPIINSTDQGGGYAVPDLKAGEWLAYTLDAVDGGWFTATARVFPKTEGNLLFLRDRITELTAVDIPNATEWSSVAGQKPFYLPPGEQIITARVVKPQFQLANFTIGKLSDASATVQAETGKIEGAYINSDHVGFHGTGFVGGIKAPDTSLVLPITVPSDGKYLLALRYANGENNAEIMITLADGQSLNLKMPYTKEWGKYEEAGTVVTLKAGPMDIKISGTGNGIVNIDDLRLLPIP